MTTAKRVIYSGQVQGVSFRYTARRLAEGFPVTGYVRNLPGGGVELVAQGEPGAVDSFLAAVAGRMAEYIGKSTVTEETPGSYRGFDIRY
jgi:acylphosphatase